MDSGYLGPGENNAKALEDDYDVMRELTPEEVLGVMDELLAQEIAWHMGHPLSQTLFTSIYVDHLLWPVPKAMEELRFGRDKSTQQDADGKMVHLVLRAYCLALIKACDFVQARVAAEYYFEVRLPALEVCLHWRCSVNDCRKRTLSPSCITAVF